MAEDWLIEAELATWKERLWAAIKDGKEYADSAAVRAEVAKAYRELGVEKKGLIPDWVITVAAHCLKAEAAGAKPPSLGELAQWVAARHGRKVTKPGIRHWKEGDRWAAACLLAKLEDADKQRQQRRRQEYDALFDAITQPKKDDAL